MTLDNAYMATKDVCEHLRISSRTLSRLRNRTTLPFPAPDYSLNGSKNRWFKHKVLEWQAQDAELNRSSR
ncbi:excisionase Xis [Providencia rettgeri]|uniref:excisionase Xis n=1 Tax=Providencia rettgeri TaxID=587 RepID=UPI001EE72B07|nr:excisionase Xis [Providencia rettgeri]MCG5368708.1 excisionase Xis [Providencia rettgeri]